MQVFQSPERTRTQARQASPGSPVSEAGQSLARVKEIQKYAKVLPHCSSLVRLNHLARCKPLQALGRGAGGAQTFQNLYEKMSKMAVTNSNSQLPLPTNNYPKIPRKKKHKKSSSKRTATTFTSYSSSTSTSTTRLCSAPTIVVSQTPHGENQLGKKDSTSRNPLLNDELRNNHPATPTFNFVSLNKN